MINMDLKMMKKNIVFQAIKLINFKNKINLSKKNIKINRMKLVFISE